MIKKEEIERAENEETITMNLILKERKENPEVGEVRKGEGRTRSKKDR